MSVRTSQSPPLPPTEVSGAEHPAARRETVAARALNTKILRRAGVLIMVALSSLKVTGLIRSSALLRWR
jgi:hypothetical protein